MSKTTTEQKAKSQDKKALSNFSQDQIFDFLYGERIKNILERTYDIAIYEDAKTSIPLLKYFLDRYFGRPVTIQAKDYVKANVTLEEVLASFDGDPNDIGEDYD
jgi:hypothetical protein